MIVTVSACCNRFSYITYLATVAFYPFSCHPLDLSRGLSTKFVDIIISLIKVTFYSSNDSGQTKEINGFLISRGQ